MRIERTYYGMLFNLALAVYINEFLEIEVLAFPITFLMIIILSLFIDVINYLK